jgi:hypothetical protein
MQRSRQMFLEKSKNKEMISFFHKLIRAFHDGIILTHGHNIVYKNKVVDNIMDIKKE